MMASLVRLLKYNRSEGTCSGTDSNRNGGCSRGAAGGGDENVLASKGDLDQSCRIDVERTEFCAPGAILVAGAEFHLLPGGPIRGNTIVFGDHGER